MQIIGIVAEYNPFHTGHSYQIECSREQFDVKSPVVAVMSGNWVQQGTCAVADKWTRARLALMGGADLVLELPTVWAASTAESFARGAAGILHAAGVVDRISFGSECGDAEKLRRVAACLDSGEYQNRLAEHLSRGTTFAACRQAAVGELLGEELAALLSAPNNNLGVEYIRALNALNSRIVPMTVQREGAAHNSISEGSERPRFVSATQIRLHLQNGCREQAAPYLMSGAWNVLEQHLTDLPKMERVSRAMLACVRKMTAEDWAKLPDSGVGEGLPLRLERAGRQCVSMDQFFELAKTKRYTLARLRRLVLWAYLGLTAADVPEKPPYIRILGFNTRGRDVLRQMKAQAQVPIITKPAHARELDAPGRDLFELEASCTDLFDLCMEQIPAPGREWTNGPVILE